MRIITSLSDLDGTLDPGVKELLRERLNMLGEFDGTLARFIVVEPGDSLTEVEKEIGYPFDPPVWEWLVDHGGLFEAPFIMSDDGFAHVLIVTDRPGVEPALLAYCRQYAEPATPADIL